jgi:flagellar protein FlbD
VIKLTRLDGKEIFLNKNNIQWIEALPDTTITIMSGARIIVREKINELLNIIDERIKFENQLCSLDELEMHLEKRKISPEMTENI